MKKTITSILFGTLVLFSTITVYGNYNPNAASTYAQNNYDETSSNDYYYFSGGNCTNFVSQCIKRGGVTVKENRKLTDINVVPTFSYIYDDDTSYIYWYMKKKYNKYVFRNYYLLTKSWSNVQEFRIYHNHHEGTAYSYKNNASGRQQLLRDVKVGDVVQVGDKHSVIISQKFNSTINGVKYCGQSSSRLNTNIDVLFKFADDKNCNTFYRIVFK